MFEIDFPSPDIPPNEGLRHIPQLPEVRIASEDEYADAATNPQGLPDLTSEIDTTCIGSSDDCGIDEAEESPAPDTANIGDEPPIIPPDGPNLAGRLEEPEEPEEGGHDSSVDTVELNEIADAIVGILDTIGIIEGQLEAENEADAEIDDSQPIDAEPDLPAIAAPSDKWVWIGPCRDVLEIEGVAEYFQGQRDNATFPGETALTDDERELIQTVQGGIVTVADRLGVDIRSRLPAITHYHTFNTRADYTEVVEGRWGKGTAGGGACMRPEAGILFTREDSPARSASVIFHETAHDVALQRVSPTVTSYATNGENDTAEVDNMHLSSGYNNISHGLNEIITDLFMHGAMVEAGFTTRVYSYGAIDAIADGVIREVAGAHNVHPQQISDELIRGALVKDMTGLRRISSVLGTEGTRRFLALTGKESYDEAQLIAHVLNLPAAVEIIEQCKATDTIDVFDWSVARPMRW